MSSSREPIVFVLKDGEIIFKQHGHNSLGVNLEEATGYDYESDIVSRYSADDDIHIYTVRPNITAIQMVNDQIMHLKDQLIERRKTLDDMLQVDEGEAGMRISEKAAKEMELELANPDRPKTSHKTLSHKHSSWAVKGGY